MAALTGKEPIASHVAMQAWIRAIVRATLDDVKAEHASMLAPED